MSDELNAMTLKPCPFCGEPAKTMSRPSNHTSTGMFYVVHCYCGGNCACAWKCGDTAQQAADLWNNRT